MIQCGLSDEEIIEKYSSPINLQLEDELSPRTERILTIISSVVLLTGLIIGVLILL